MFQKNCSASRKIQPAANFENVTSIARSISIFFWRFVCCSTPSQKRFFGIQVFTRFRSTGVIIASSHALWSVLSNKVTWMLGHCWVDTPHIYTSEGDSLFFQSCLLFTVTVTLSDWDDVNRSTSLEQFRLGAIDSSLQVQFFGFIPQGAKKG